MINFCTLFDSNYLSRGLAMYNSLMRHCPSAHLYIICLDDKLYEYLTKEKYSNITAISLKDVESHFKELENAKQERTYIEYIFTLSPAIALFILEKFSDINMITTLDADIFFFSDPTMLFQDADSFSIGITPHRFSNHLKFLEKFGKYNVSFQTFKNDPIGKACLKKWKDDCIKWCFDKFEDNKFADQKYLDDWSEEYCNIKVYDNGAGIAPWNIKNTDIALDNNGNISIKKEPLIYYHFHGLRNITDNLLSLGLSEYGVIRRNRIIQNIYLNYVEEISNLKTNFNKNQIKRGMHPLLGKFVFNIFLADLYYYKNGKLIRIFNLNICRRIFSIIKNHYKHASIN